MPTDKLLLQSVTSHTKEGTYLACCLIKQGGNPNLTNSQGTTLLEIACRSPKISPLLLTSIISSRGYRQSGIFRNNRNTLHILTNVDEKYDTKISKVLSGLSKRALYFKDIFKIINEKDRDGNTCLHLSVKNKLLLTTDILVREFKADVHVRNIDQKLPLHMMPLKTPWPLQKQFLDVLDIPHIETCSAICNVQ